MSRIRDARAAIESGLARLEEQRSWLDLLPDGIGSILDVGCGAGYHSKYFLARGMRPVAIDSYEGAFQFHGEIEFRHCSFEQLGGERFDAVFASHVLEHCPDTMSALLAWRERIHDGGYLIVIVPKYSSLVCNDHWTTGWNAGQLAMLLVAAGFDCSQSAFAEFGIHVCGYGRKAGIPATRMNLDASRAYLPAALADTMFTDGVNRFLEGGVAFASHSELREKSMAGACRLPAFRLEEGRAIRFSEEGWAGVDSAFTEAMDLSTDWLYIAVAGEGRQSHLRLAVASGPDEDPLADVAEFWFPVEPGLGHFTVRPYHFTTLRGAPDFTRVRLVSIGGSGRDSSFLVWAFAGDGRNLLPPPPAPVDPDASDSPTAGEPEPAA